MPFLLIVCVLISSCSNGKIKLSSTKFELNKGDEAQIVAESKLPISYESEDAFHASVDADGLITARFVGSTRIRVSTDDDIKYVDVTVNPKYYLFTKPDIEFGADRSSVVSTYGEPDDESSTDMLYNNYCMIGIKLLVLLKNNKVDYYGVAVPSEMHSSLIKYLAERYLYIGTENSVMFFATEIDSGNAEFYIAVTYMSGYYVVAYLPMSKSKDAVESLYKVIS